MNLSSTLAELGKHDSVGPKGAEIKKINYENQIQKYLDFETVGLIKTHEHFKYVFLAQCNYQHNLNLYISAATIAHKSFIEKKECSEFPEIVFKIIFKDVPD